MKMIYLISIVACLTEQLKADVFSVENTEISQDPGALVIVKKDPDSIVTFIRDIDEGTTNLFVLLEAHDEDVLQTLRLRDPCDMDTSSRTGLLAAIFWKTLGIDSCPIKAGDYPIPEKFNQTGVLDGTFGQVDVKVTIRYELRTKNNDGKIQSSSELGLLEGEESLIDW